MTAPLARPPAVALVASLALFALGATTGAALVTLQDALYDVARREVVKRPEVHGFAGVEVIDQQRIAEVVEQSNNAFRMFHVHALGVGMLVLLVSIVIVNLPLSERVKRTACVLVSLGALYPPGWLLLGALIPRFGVKVLRTPVEWGVFVPFAGAALLAIWATLAFSLATLRRGDVADAREWPAPVAVPGTRDDVRARKGR